MRCIINRANVSGGNLWRRTYHSLVQGIFYARTLRGYRGESCRQYDNEISLYTRNTPLVH